MKQSWPYFLIIMGASLWGMIGWFVQGLYHYRLTPVQVVAVRVMTASLLLIPFLLIKAPSRLKIRPRDSVYFIGTGILSVVFFNWAYFTAIREISLSLAAALLYTGPAFVAVIARYVFHEPFTSRKIFALVLTLFGCASVVGLLPALNFSVSPYGFLVGLASGLGYALYSIFGKMASNRYSSLTIAAYTFLFASLALLFQAGLWEKRELFADWRFLSYAFGLGLVPTVLAYVFYTAGLSRVESSRAAIMTTIEPVIAVLLGVLVFGDQLTVWQACGMMLILFAVVLVNGRTGRKAAAKETQPSAKLEQGC